MKIPGDSKSYRALLRSKVILLLGAGASAPLGMPTMDRYKDLIDARYHGIADKIFDANKDKENDLEFLLGRLTLYETIASERASDTNLQRWLNLNSHQPCQDASQFKKHIFERIVRGYGQVSPQAKDKAVYIYSTLINGLRRLTGSHPPVLPIFTTNYDLVPECVRDGTSGTHYCTGIGGSGEMKRWSRELYLRARYGVAVFRLHGCSHWMVEKDSRDIIFQALPDTAAPEYREPCVLYPLPGKETRLDEEPFRTAYQHLETCLRSAKVIVIIGYSGRDPFIQVALREALESPRQKQLIYVTGSGDLKPGPIESLKSHAHAFEHIGGGIEEHVADVLGVAESMARDAPVSAVPSS
jgi:hypothetical protein